jgi:hypothetical protein
MNVMRDTDDPDLVVLFSRITDESKAKEFTETPSAREAAETSGVIGVPELMYLTESCNRQ